MMGLFTSDLDSENNPRPYPSPSQVVATVGNCNDNILVLLLCNFFQMKELEWVQNCRRDGAAVMTRGACTRGSYITPFVSVQNKWNTLKHYKPF